jgi:hypothetical protein
MSVRYLPCDHLIRVEFLSHDRQALVDVDWARAEGWATHVCTKKQWWNPPTLGPGIVYPNSTPAPPARAVRSAFHARAIAWPVSTLPTRTHASTSCPPTR